MKNPHRVTEDFEDAVCEYTGAPYAVATTSCTMGLFLSLRWLASHHSLPAMIGCEKFTYIGVAQSIINAGSRIYWVDNFWQKDGYYLLAPTTIIDSARLFTRDMYIPGSMMVTSHHWSKTLGIQQGGMILTSEPEAVQWLRKARFDGRTPGVPLDRDTPIAHGYHAYMSPEVAAEGLMRLSTLPENNAPLQESNYTDLAQLDCFKPHVELV